MTSQNYTATFYQMIFKMSQFSHVGEIDLASEGGICLKPCQGVDNSQLAQVIQNCVDRAGWHISRMHGHSREIFGGLIIEPNFTAPYRLQPNAYIYHVAQKNNRLLIGSTGLKLATGGSTRLGRIYPPRIFFAVDMSAAFEFVRFQTRVIPGQASARRRSEFDIWRFRPGRERPFWRDLAFPGRAIWTNTHVRWEEISRVRFWESLMDAYEAGRRLGVR